MLQRNRKSNGLIGSLLSTLFVLLTVAIAAFAVDVTHVISASRELQSAVDAGALAGAAHLSEPTLELSRSEALTVTARNCVEGVPVASTSPDTTVSAECVASTASDQGTVTVTASRKVSSIFSKIFGRDGEIIEASATAGGAAKLVSVPAGNTFPIAVSINSVGQDSEGNAGTPLQNLQVGEQFTLLFGPKRNSAFTSFGASSSNNSYFEAAINEVLQISQRSERHVIPSVSLGMELNLNNGEAVFQQLIKDPQYAALLKQPFILLPLFEGDSPFNETVEVAGFMALKVTSVTKNKGVPAIVGTIVRPAVCGKSDVFFSPAQPGPAERFSPLTVRLLR